MGHNYATNVPDLLRRYGVSSTALLRAMSTTGKVFYVDSVTGSDSYSGDKPTRALATLDKAFSLVTANKGDVVLVMPKHAETLTAAAGADLDIAGVTVIGLGNGEARPVITFGTAAAASLDINGADIYLGNVVLKNDIDSQTSMVNIKAKQFTAEDIEIVEGTAKQALIYVSVGSAANDADRTTLRRVRILATTAGANSGIKLAAVSDATVIEDCYIDGDFADAGIHNPTALVVTNLLLRGNIVRNRQTGDHAIELVSAVTGQAVGNHLFADTSGTIFDPGSLFCTGNFESAAIDRFGTPSPAPGTQLAAGKSLADAVGFDGSAVVTASAGMLRVMAGTLFVVKKTLTSSNVLTTGVDVTGVSSGGDLVIESVHVMTDGTGLAAGTLFTLETNNAKGKAAFFAEAVADLGANATEIVYLGNVGTADAGSFSPLLESGKKVIAKCTVANCTGAGTVDVYLVCRRLADNVAMAAAA